MDKSKPNKLRKYLPFLNYVVDKTQHEHKQNFERMRNWIAINHNFCIEYHDKLEKAVHVAYKSISRAEKFPPELHTLFTVDLCSDGDDDCNDVKSKTNTKPTVNEDVFVVSEHETDAKSVSKSNENISQSFLVKPAHRDSNAGVFNGKIKAVHAIGRCNNNKDKDYPNSTPSTLFAPQTTLMSGTTIYVENTLADTSELPLEGQRPIFFRRHNLPDITTITDHKSTNENSSAKNNPIKIPSKVLEITDFSQIRNILENVKKTISVTPKPVETQLCQTTKTEQLNIDEVPIENGCIGSSSEVLNQQTYKSNELQTRNTTLAKNSLVATSMKATITKAIPPLKSSNFKPRTSQVPQNWIATSSKDKLKTTLIFARPKSTIQPITSNNLSLITSVSSKNQLPPLQDVLSSSSSLASNAQFSMTVVPILTTLPMVELPQSDEENNRNKGRCFNSAQMEPSQTLLAKDPLSEITYTDHPRFIKKKISDEKAKKLKEQQEHIREEAILPTEVSKNLTSETFKEERIDQELEYPFLGFGDELMDFRNGRKRRASISASNAITEQASYLAEHKEEAEDKDEPNTKNNKRFSSSSNESTDNRRWQKYKDGNYLRENTEDADEETESNRSKVKNGLSPLSNECSGKSTFQKAIESPPIKTMKIGKRRASLSARKAITEQASYLAEETEDAGEENKPMSSKHTKIISNSFNENSGSNRHQKVIESPPKKAAPIGKRRASLSARKAINEQASYLAEKTEEVGEEYAPTPRKPTQRLSTSSNESSNNSKRQKAIESLPKKTLAICKMRSSLSAHKAKNEQDAKAENETSSSKSYGRISISSNESRDSSKRQTNIKSSQKITMPIERRRASLSARKAIYEQANYFAENADDAGQENLQSSSQPTKRLLCSNNEINHKSKQQTNIEYQSYNALPKIKKCRVILTKLSLNQPKSNTEKKSLLIKEQDITMTNGMSETQIETLSHKIQKITSEINNPEKTVQSVVRKSLQDPQAIKNTDCNMTERNCYTCVFCKKRPEDLTHHYIHVHKTESYVSRLSWEELNELELNVPLAQEITTKSGDCNVQAYRVDCPFCPRDFRTKYSRFCDLRKHYSKHTGEYAYGCIGCDLQKTSGDLITMHQRQKKCNGKGVKKLYQYPTDQLVINMYICNICFFVQLNDENVFKHLREQHGRRGKDPSEVKEIILAIVKDCPVMRVPLSTLPNIMPPNQVVEKSADLEVLVSNEPFVDEGSTHQDENYSANCDYHLVPIKPTLVVKSTLSSHDFLVENSIIEHDSVDIKPDFDNMEQLLGSDLNPSQKQGRNLELDKRVLEEKINDEKLLLESVKALLQKFSASTGIRPDLLYQCPEKDCGSCFSGFSLWLKHMKAIHNSIVAECPHCCSQRKNVQSIKLTVDDFEQHFKMHSMKLYFCFHCFVSLGDENELIKHATEDHVHLSKMRIERIPYNLSYTFYIIIEKNLFPKRIEFLVQLNKVFKSRVQRQDTMAAELQNLSIIWPLAKNDHWLERLQLPEYRPQSSTLCCMLPACQQKFTTKQELFEHLFLHDRDLMTYLYQCGICKMQYGNNWKLLIEHLFLHHSPIYVCCVCSHIDSFRGNMVTHVCEKHNLRDVPQLLIHRSLNEIKVELAFSFAAGQRTFTSTNCFFNCGTSNLTVGTFVSHLRREHSLKLYYFCHYCDEHLPHLQLSEEHHRQKHANLDKQFKIRCQIALNRERVLSISAFEPLKICFSDASHGSCLNIYGMDLSSNMSDSNIRIKTDDDDVRMMEEDEVIAANEINRLQGWDNRSRYSIKQLHINPNLF